MSIFTRMQAKARPAAKAIFGLTLALTCGFALAGCIYGDGGTNNNGGGNSGTTTSGAEAVSYADTDILPSYLQGTYTLKQGDTAPDFTVQLVDENGLTGETLTLSDLRGKPVILSFWAVWCGYCVQDLPAYNQLQQEYGDAFTMVAVNVGGDTYGELKEFIASKGHDITYALGNATTGTGYPCAGIPYDVVVDANGEIAFIAEGSYGEYTYTVMKMVLEELLH